MVVGAEAGQGRFWYAHKGCAVDRDGVVRVRELLLRLKIGPTVEGQLLKGSRRVGGGFSGLGKGGLCALLLNSQG